MTLTFDGRFSALKKCVRCTRLDGYWKKPRDGHRQFIADNGGILNWASSTGSIWFQGESSGAEELEHEFKAVGKRWIKERCQKAQEQQTEDIGTLKRLLANVLLENEKLRRRRAC